MARKTAASGRRVLHDTRTVPGKTVEAFWDGVFTIDILLDGQKVASFHTDEVKDYVLVTSDQSATIGAKTWLRRNPDFATRTASRKEAEIQGHFTTVERDGSAGGTWVVKCTCGWSEGSPTRSGGFDIGQQHEDENGGYTVASRKQAAEDGWAVGDSAIVGGRIYEVANVGDDWLLIGDLDTWPDGKRKVVKPAPGQPLTLTEYSPRKTATGVAPALPLLRGFGHDGKHYSRHGHLDSGSPEEYWVNDGDGYRQIDEAEYTTALAEARASHSDIYRLPGSSRSAARKTATTACPECSGIAVASKSRIECMDCGHKTAPGGQ